MKRDWDAIRKILLAIEASRIPDAQIDSDKIEGVDPDVAAYNMALLLKAHLIEGGGRLESMPGANPWAFALRLTWDGHELLDSIRGETLWSRIKAIAAEKGIDLTLDAVKALAKMAIGAMTLNSG